MLTILSLKKSKHGVVFVWQILLFIFLLTSCSRNPEPKIKPKDDIETMMQTHELRPMPSVKRFAPANLQPGYAAGYRLMLGNVGYTAASFDQLPTWPQQSLTTSFSAFLKSCDKIAIEPAWFQVCAVARQISGQYPDVVHDFFEKYFTPWQMDENSRPNGMVTGYYEPALMGSLTPNAQARYPIYGVPNDFISVPISAADRHKGWLSIQPTENNRGILVGRGGYSARLADFPLTARSRALKGRIVGDRFVPYFTRGEINAGALENRAPILAYANDPVELFFLQIQGSGRLILENGHSIRLGYADKNDHPYVSIGRYMASQGYLSLGETSMQGIKAWLERHPHKLHEIMAVNPSFVFFRQLGAEDEGPIGALGVPLTAEVSAAVDHHHIPLGAPFFLATTHPDGGGLNRLMVAQDKGSAIVGALRVDYFWGFGDLAGEKAGQMKYPGYVWLLLPKGVAPSYQP